MMDLPYHKLGPILLTSTLTIDRVLRDTHHLCRDRSNTMANVEAEHMEQPKSKSTRKQDEEPIITTIDCFRILFGLLLLNSLLSYFITGDSYMWNYNPYWIRPKALAAKLVRCSYVSYITSKS